VPVSCVVKGLPWRRPGNSQPFLRRIWSDTAGLPGPTRSGNLRGCGTRLHEGAGSKNRKPSEWRDVQNVEHVLGRYLISDQPMTEEEWIKAHATVIDEPKKIGLRNWLMGGGSLAGGCRG